PRTPRAVPRFAAGRESRLNCLLAGESARVSMADYAIISLGGKQYRVREGDRLLVDRLSTEQGKTFHPDVLFTGGNGKPNLSPRIQVTAKVVGSPLGPKIRIGKYKAKKGYRRHTGFRAKLTDSEIQSIGARSTRKQEPAAAAKPQ